MMLKGFNQEECESSIVTVDVLIHFSVIHECSCIHL